MAKDTLVTEKQMVLFELGTETYGLDIATVHEIIRMQPITKVPKASFYVEGVINLRGRVIPVIDIGKRFGFDKTEKAKNNRIVVVKIKDTTLGIIVDAVTEVIRIPIDSIDPVSDMSPLVTLITCWESPSLLIRWLFCWLLINCFPETRN